MLKREGSSNPGLYIGLKTHPKIIPFSYLNPYLSPVQLTINDFLLFQVPPSTSQADSKCTMPPTIQTRKCYTLTTELIFVLNTPPSNTQHL